MDSRARKKFNYGIVFLLILVVIAFPFWFFSRPAPTCEDKKLNQGEEEIDCGGPCIPCAIKNLKPVQAAAELQVLSGATNVIIEFSNPNIFYGPKTFRYTLTLKGASGMTLYEETNEGFLYPAEQNRVIIHANLPVDAELLSGQPEVVVSNENWQLLEDFSQPEALLRETQVAIARGGDDAQVSAVVVNNNPFPLSRVDVSVILHDSRGRTVGLSKTVVRDVPAFGDRFFKLAVPFEGDEISPNRTEIFVYPLR